MSVRVGSRRSGKRGAAVSTLGFLLLSCALASPALSGPDSSGTALPADIQQMWQVRTGIDNARRVRVSTNLGTFEAASLRFEQGQPGLIRPHGPTPSRELTWTDVQQIEALHVGRPSPPRPPGRGGIMVATLIVTAMTIGPAFFADDPAEYGQMYLSTMGIAFGGALVIGIPTMHLSSRWHTVYRSQEAKPRLQ